MNAAAFLIKRALSPAFYERLPEQFGTAWGAGDMRRAGRLARMITRDAFKRKGLQPVNPFLFTAPGLPPRVAMDLEGRAPLRDVSGRLSYQLLKPITLPGGLGSVFPLHLENLQSYGHGKGRFLSAFGELIGKLDRLGARGTHIVPLLEPGRSMSDPITRSSFDALSMWAHVPHRRGGFTHFYGRRPGGYEAGDPLRYIPLTEDVRDSMVRHGGRWDTGEFLRIPQHLHPYMGNLPGPAALGSFE